MPEGETRDERGRVTGMTSERARELAKKSLESRATKVETKARKMLEETSGLKWAAADESLRLLATQAAEGGGGAVTAHRLFLQRIGKLKEDTGGNALAWDPESGKPCPTCGGARVTIFVAREAMDEIQESM